MTLLTRSWTRLLRFRPVRLPQRCLVTVAIESSCDDSAVAVLEAHPGDEDRFRHQPFARLTFDGKVTANNNKFGGIHPLVALSSHQAALAGLVRDAIRHLPDATPAEKEEGRAIPLLPPGHAEARRSKTPSTDLQWKRKPDFVSVTRGPGMRSNLAVGLEVAKGLSVAWDIPMVGVNHMLGHLLTPRLEHACKLNTESPQAYPDEMDPKFPMVSLLVSGGHTLLVYSPALDKHLIVAETCDIAAGDCIDKIARMVLPPGMLANRNPSQPPGACLTEFALADMDLDQWKASYQPQDTHTDIMKSRNHPHYKWALAPPYADSKGGSRRKILEFSFSGLTAGVERLLQFKWDTEINKLGKEPRLDTIAIEERRALALEAIRVVFEHVASRLVLGLDHIKTYQTLERKAANIKSHQDYRIFARDLHERGLKRQARTNSNEDLVEGQSFEDEVDSTYLNYLEHQALILADAAKARLTAGSGQDQSAPERASTNAEPKSTSLDISSIVVSGGVAANECFRHVLETTLRARGYGDIRILAPSPKLCTDNAAMVAWAGFEMYQRGASTSLSARPIRKWHLGPGIEEIVPERKTPPDDATGDGEEELVRDAMEAPSTFYAKL
jgi:N6-L-threonylcarbamoyladenine synthase